MNSEPISDYGDHMLLTEFIAAVEQGAFIDYDGTGYYANETKMFKQRIQPSDVWCEKVKTQFTHVVWFNK